MPWRANKLRPFRLQGSGSQSDNNSNADSVDFGDWDTTLGLGEAVQSKVDHEGELNEVQDDSQVGDIEPERADALSLLGAKRIVKGPVADDSRYSQMLAKAFISCKDHDDFLFPWETGHLKQFFQTDSESLDVEKATLTVKADWMGLGWKSSPAELEQVSLGPQLVEDGVLHTKAILAMPDRTFAEQHWTLVELAVSKWVTIVSSCLLASETGRLIINLGNLEAQKEGARRIVQSIIGTRSPRTASSRANSLLGFMRWAHDEFSDMVNPFEEEKVWKYLCHLQDSRAAPTRGSNFLSSCRYAHFIFGFECLGGVCQSRRVQGITNLMYVDKRPLRQSLVLSVDQVRTLHSMLVDSGLDDTDRAFTAYILIALYGRCRHSDLARIHDVVHDHDQDGGFCEIRTSHHKTARTVSLKTTLLPIVIPALSVEGSAWLDVAQSALLKVGLKFDGLIDGPIMRPPSKLGLCERGLVSSEVTKFLRLCFEDGPQTVSGGARISSHSLKATALSWCGKYGVSPADQAILGRHASSYNETSIVYSRDASVRAVRKLQEVLLAISRSEFNPDAPRSAYFKKGALEAGATPAAADTVWVKDESDDGGSVSSESSSGEDSSGDDLPPPPKCIRVWLGDVARSHFWRHKQTKIVHYCEQLAVSEVEDGVVFACGRPVGANYAGAKDFDSSWMCKMCKSKALKDGALGQKRKQ